MRKVLVVLTAASVVAACESGTSRPPSPKEQSVRHARSLLPENDLRRAIPEGFKLDRVVVNDDEYHRKGWVTLGVRLENGPTPYARAIFYVLRDADAAKQMYREQTRMTREMWQQEHSLGWIIPGRPPAPFSVMEPAVPNLCGVRSDYLYWCHALQDNVYLLIQSSATEPAPGKEYPAEYQEAAFDLMRAFGMHLQDIST